MVPFKYSEEFLDSSSTPSTTSNWTRRYRSRYEIIAAIIESASKEAQDQMHLMFDAYLSYTQLHDDYLPLLLDAGLLLEKVDGCYIATERAMEFLRMYSEIREIAEAKSLG